LSEFVVVPEYCIVKIPDNVPLDVAGELKRRSLKRNQDAVADLFS